MHSQMCCSRQSLSAVAAADFRKFDLRMEVKQNLIVRISAWLCCEGKSNSAGFVCATAVCVRSERHSLDDARETGQRRSGCFVVCTGRCGATAPLCNSLTFLGQEQLSSSKGASDAASSGRLCV